MDIFVLYFSTDMVGHHQLATLVLFKALVTVTRTKIEMKTNGKHRGQIGSFRHGQYASNISLDGECAYGD